MRYQLRNGVLLIRICGADFLVPSKSLWPEVSQIKPITKLELGMIKVLFNTGETDQILRLFRVFMRNKTDDQILEIINQKIFDLQKNGYIIEVDDYS